VSIHVICQKKLYVRLIIVLFSLCAGLLAVTYVFFGKSDNFIGGGQIQETLIYLVIILAFNTVGIHAGPDVELFKGNLILRTYLSKIVVKINSTEITSDKYSTYITIKTKNIFYVLIGLVMLIGPPFKYITISISSFTHNNYQDIIDIMAKHGD